MVWVGAARRCLLVLTFVEDGLRIGGAAAVASGYKFTVAAGLLSVLVVTHGIGSYAAKLGGHKRHRDALMFVGAQDLSVLAALLLLAATGPGGLSVDAKYGKGN